MLKPGQPTRHALDVVQPAPAQVGVGIEWVLALDSLQGTAKPSAMLVTGVTAAQPPRCTPGRKRRPSEMKRWSGAACAAQGGVPRLLSLGDHQPARASGTATGSQLQAPAAAHIGLVQDLSAHGKGCIDLLLRNAVACSTMDWAASAGSLQGQWISGEQARLEAGTACWRHGGSELQAARCVRAGKHGQAAGKLLVSIAVHCAACTPVR